MVASNRDRALDAAIELLGTEGMRALTHRRVDTRADLPAGSTSNYFRTRAALLRGVVERMVGVELPRVAGASRPESAADFVDRLVELYAFFVGRNRIMTAARLALFVEAAHDEEVRALLARGRGRFEEAMVTRFAALGAADPERATQLLAVCFEGLFLHDIGGHAEIDARPVIEAAVRSAL